MKKHLLSLLVTTALFASLVVGCQETNTTPTTTASSTPAAEAVSETPSGPIEVVHSRGTLIVETTPERVAVYDLSSLDTLDALGVPVLGVAGSLFPSHLEKYKGDEYIAIGTLFEPDYEALNAASPDFIIVGGRSSAKYEELEKLAPTVDMSVVDDDYLGSSKKNIEALAQLFGKTVEANEKLDVLDASIGDLADQAKDAGKGLIILTTGGKMSAYGPGSRFGVIHSAFGFAPSVENLDTSRHGEPISFEFIAKTNPDWLFVVDRDAAIGETGKSAQAVLDNALVNKTTAAQKGQIVYLNPENWYLAGGGLNTLQMMVDEIADALGEKQPESP